MRLILADCMFVPAVVVDEDDTATSELLSSTTTSSSFEQASFFLLKLVDSVKFNEELDAAETSVFLALQILLMMDAEVLGTDADTFDSSFL